MPKKTPKTVDTPEGGEATKPKRAPRKPKSKPVSDEPGLNAVPEAAPAPSTEARLDQEAEARMGSESPAPVSAAVEAHAQAADVFEEGFEERVPAELPTPVAKEPVLSEAVADAMDSQAAAMDEDDEEEEAEAEDAADDAEELEEEDIEGEDESVEEDAGFTPQPRPPAKLERLQKILSQAGVASRRHAEELITEGRVQVNGKIVTQLGSKADAGRDHIRVDGKLLHGAERLRYFVLNKPRGYVTTVSDPEGRPTVMEFFAKMSERLYPVGRLDYLSEGLLLVTNDGDLANKLTKASTGVDKTYLVKVSGQPTEEELERLRGGVSIERGKPGEGRVRTAPAQVRQVRQGDNPWYEVVLIEGRNRELRKMFEEIGHFVEKIRRVGYGPLVLDQEPGTAEGAGTVGIGRTAQGGGRQVTQAQDHGGRTPQGCRERQAPDRGAPAQRPVAAGQTAAGATRGGPREGSSALRSGQDRTVREGRAGDFRPKRSFGRDAERGSFPATRPTGDRARPAGRGGRAGEGFGAGKPGPGKFAARPASEETSRFGQGRPAWKKDDRGPRPPARFKPEDRAAGRGGSFAIGAGRGPGGSSSAPGRGSTGSGPRGAAGRGRTGGDRPFGAKPAWNKPAGGARPYQGPPAPRREAPPVVGDEGEKRPSRLHIEPVESERRGTGERRPPQGAGRSGATRPQGDRPRFDRPGTGRGPSDRPRPETPRFDRSSTDRGGSRTGGSSRPASGQSRFGDTRTGSNRPATRPFSGSRPRGEGLARPFTTSTGKPRAGGARPSSKPGRTSGGPASRPGGTSSWKPKPSPGGKGRPAGGGGSRPSANGASRPSNGRSGPRPSGKRPGGSGGKRH